MIEYILFVVGIVFILKGADFLIEGSSALATKFGVSQLVIGLTIVSFGTSMPELVVNMAAVMEGTGDIALGTIIGSNISNIFLILGLTAVFFPPRIEHSTVWKEIPFSLLAVIVLFILTNEFLIDGFEVFSLARTDGLLMLCFFTIFIYYMFSMFKNRNNNNPESKELIKMKSHKIIFLILAGFLGLYFGGRWTVDGAVFIAGNFGLSEFMVSATIIAIGTSLPELVTSIKAAMKKNVDLAVGNVVGSNIFNIFLILGITATVSPLPIPDFLNMDIGFLFSATALLFLFMFIGEKRKLEKWQGCLFVLFYLTYITFLILRG